MFNIKQVLYACLYLDIYRGIQEISLKIDLQFLLAPTAPCVQHISKVKHTKTKQLLLCSCLLCAIVRRVFTSTHYNRRLNTRCE